MLMVRRGTRWRLATPQKKSFGLRSAHSSNLALFLCDLGVWSEVQILVSLSQIDCFLSKFQAQFQTSGNRAINICSDAIKWELKIKLEAFRRNDLVYWKWCRENSSKIISSNDNPSNTMVLSKFAKNQFVGNLFSSKSLSLVRLIFIFIPNKLYIFF